MIIEYEISETQMLLDTLKRTNRHLTKEENYIKEIARIFPYIYYEITNNKNCVYLRKDVRKIKKLLEKLELADGF